MAAEREVAVLLFLAGLNHQAASDQCALNRPDLDWNFLVRQLTWHKLEGLFLQQDLVRPPADHALLSQATADHARRQDRCRRLDEVAQMLGKRLDREGVPYAVLKGPYLAHRVLRCPAARVYADLDLLVPRRHVDRAARHLREFGFHQAHLRAGPTLVPATDRERRGCALFLHHLFPFRKIEGPHVLTVEVHTDLFARNLDTMQRAFPVDLVESGPSWSSRLAFDLGGTSSWTLPPDLFLLHLCLHVYGDQIGVERVASGTELVLRDFADLAAFFDFADGQVNWRNWLDLVHNAHAEIAAWQVLSRLAILCPRLVPRLSPIVEALAAASAEERDEFGLPWELQGRQRGLHSLPLMQRLFDFGASSRADFRSQRHLFRPSDYWKSRQA